MSTATGSCGLHPGQATPGGVPASASVSTPDIRGLWTEWRSTEQVVTRNEGATSLTRPQADTGLRAGLHTHSLQRLLSLNLRRRACMCVWNAWRKPVSFTLTPTNQLHGLQIKAPKLVTVSAHWPEDPYLGSPSRHTHWETMDEKQTTVSSHQSSISCNKTDSMMHFRTWLQSMGHKDLDVTEATMQH